MTLVVEPMILIVGGATFRRDIDETPAKPSFGSNAQLAVPPSCAPPRLGEVPDVGSLKLFEGARKAAEELINRGLPGIGSQALCSAILSRELHKVCAPLGVDVPKTRALNAFLLSLGYTKFPSLLKWRGTLHTVWLRGNVLGVRAALDSTLRSRPGAD